MVAALARLAERAAEHATLVMAGRSHNVAAQATTLGKRFANAGEELLQALRRVEELLARYPLRGHQGPGRHPAGHARPARRGRERSTSSRRPSPRHLGFEATLTNVGQVYPRSLDLDVVAALVQAGAGPVEPGHHHPADGRPRAGHRGLPARAGRLVGHAPQDEQPVLRADQRARASCCAAT